MKRLLSLLVVILLVCTIVLSGCTQKAPDEVNKDVKSSEGTEEKAPVSEDEDTPENFNAEGFPIVNEKITLSMMGSKSAIQGPWDQLKFFKKMEEMTNIAFTFDTPPSDAFEEKKNLAFASGEVPDVFFAGNFSEQQEVKYGSQGVLIPLEDLIDKHAPFIKSMFEQMPDVKKSVTTPDGHIYALPRINRAPISTSFAIWFNRPWLDKMGVTELPENTDDLYELLKRMRDEDPNGNNTADEIPFGIHHKGGEFNRVFLPAFGILSNKFYEENDKILYGYMQPNYKEFASYINKLWEEKLIDQDAFSQGTPELVAKSKAGQVGMATHAIPQLLYDVEDPEEAATYPLLSALSSSITTDKLASVETGVRRGTFAITSNCEYPEAVIRWVDWLFSEEGSLFVHYGEENDLWEYAENGLMRYIEPKDGRNIEEYRGGDITPDCGSRVPKWVRDKTEGAWDDTFQQYRIEQVDEKMAKYSKVILPLMYNTEEEQKRLDVLMTDIDKYTETMAAKFYTGEASLDEYDKFVETLKSMGIDEVTAIYQAAYDRWNSSK